MGARGSKNCCCAACTVRDGCGSTGAEALGHCCKCIPQRVCVSLYTDTNSFDITNWSVYEPIQSVEAVWCEDGGLSRQYSGTFSISYLNEIISIDFLISFRKDSYTDTCWLCLASDALGYNSGEFAPSNDGEFPDDNRVCVQMGGEYADSTIKRAECSMMEFDFEIDLYNINGGTGRISIAPADYIAQNPREDPNTYCLADRVCINSVVPNVYGLNGESENKQYGCLTELAPYTFGWQIELDDDFDDIDISPKLVTITVVNYYDILDDPTTVPILNLVTYLDQFLPDYNPEGEEATADCNRMYASWTKYDGSVFTILKDTQAKCVDCKCHCRQLCLTYSSAQGIERSIAVAENGYDGCGTFWNARIAETDFTLRLECLGCQTLQTYLVIDDIDGATILSDNSRAVICPDQLNATWSIDFGDIDSPGDNVGDLTVECLSCGEECTLEELESETCCCPYDTISRSLVATIESGCEPLVGLTINLIGTTPIGQDNDNTCWEGTGGPGPNYVPITEGGDCNTTLHMCCLSSPDGSCDFYMANGGGAPNSSSSRGTLVSCNPLEIVFNMGHDGCCNDLYRDYGIDGTFVVRVTE